MPGNNASLPKDAYLRLDELTNAIDNLEMCSHFLVSLPGLIRWKWAILALHQAIYGFAICAVKGTSDASVFQEEKNAKNKKAKSGSKLISIWEALNRADNPKYLWPGATPLGRTQAEKEALEKIFNEFRNGFEHFNAGAWSIEVSGMPFLFRTAVGVLRRLALEQGSIQYDDEDDNKNRVSAGLARLEAMLQEN